MSKFFAKLAVEILDKADELLSTPIAETITIFKDHINLFGFRFAANFTLTKE